jgi:hypothetical protein
MSGNDKIDPDSMDRVLPDGSYAISYHPKEGYRVYLPNHNPHDGDQVSDEALALIACAARLPDDPDFRAEQVAWMERMHQEIKAQE